MLVNGTKLEYQKTGDTTWTNLPGLKETPDVGVDPEKVENTCLTDSHKMYEMGIGDLPDMEYTFKYDNTKADSPYRVLRGFQDTGEVVKFKETLKDGSSTEYDAQVSVQRTGGGVNDVLEFKATMMVQSDFKFTDPE